MQGGGNAGDGQQEMAEKQTANPYNRNFYNIGLCKPAAVGHGGHASSPAADDRGHAGGHSADLIAGRAIGEQRINTDETYTVDQSQNNEQ